MADLSRLAVESHIPRYGHELRRDEHNREMTTTELPASHSKKLPRSRIKKLHRMLTSLDTQLRGRRAVIQQQQTVIHALLETRQRLDKQLYEVAKGHEGTA